MLGRFKSALMNAVGASELGLQYPNDSDNESITDLINSNLPIAVETKPYSRPSFLGLTNEETQVSADHRVRPIIVPRDLSRLPWCAGYAECINAGKSTWNEDQATAMRGDLKLLDSSTSIPYIMFSMFDGHAGYQVALTARLHLHRIILERLMAIPGDILLAEDNEAAAIKGRELIIGAIELAYRQMDQMVEQQAQKGGGGCTALTVLFLNGRLYAAGAGDSRTILVLGESERALTRDHTPDSESNRVRALGFLKSTELLKGHFTSLEFKKRPLQRDLGQMVLYREPYMTGWAYKVLAYPDLRLALISGQGKRSRVMGTIGVTRGFGDHGLKAANTGVSIKPFLSSQPEVQCLDLEEYNLTERDCIIMATDGLWDVVSDKVAANLLRKTLAPENPSLEYRLTMGAQELVQAARGRLVGRVWRLKSEMQENGDDEILSMASVDDISVMVVPLYPYLCEHRQWVKTQQQERRHSINSLQSSSNDAT
ncbi:protein phosphatase 1H [Nasonia vitripennis]|uniref:PPM-type phosphatase domain-containing protein n=1 Tax=Nasonia vitripennis TaxID=7425 RepID=A0A7M7G7X5_NASVI|nr:protein phosphatase 1H [Nasonia vitripennis]XP_008213746.1 protein phosphatase 1H [Nasonia vitripennis]XP_008213747.1 protein phosphatase 1H [Nasonia vitripennis]XP_016839735.1 protein phosphatase 1H [Nasonia vitripennis]XP_016839737.1 protein phosphatase 1H [Nasonia vitripennis]